MHVLLFLIHLPAMIYDILTNDNISLCYLIDEDDVATGDSDEDDDDDDGENAFGSTHHSSLCGSFISFAECTFS